MQKAAVGKDFSPARQGGALPFRPARRPMPAVPAAALPPRSAPRSEHFARLEGKASETPRGAAGGDAATPSQSSPPPHAARAKKRAALYKTLRPAHPHRTPHPGHFSRGRKVSVLRRTTWGGPASPWPGGVPVLPSGAQNAPRFRFSRAVCPCCRAGHRRPPASLRPGGVPCCRVGRRTPPGFASAGRCARAAERGAEGPRLRFGRAVCRAAEWGTEGPASPRPGGVAGSWNLCRNLLQ